MLTYDGSHERQPLDTITLQAEQAGTLLISDATGTVYHRQTITDRATVLLGGALGDQRIELQDADGRVLGSCTVRVDCSSGITEAPRWQRFWKLLHWNMLKGREGKIVRHGGRAYVLFSDWIRDHVHILKGKGYVDGRVRDAIDLFATAQHENGRIFDFYMPHTPGSTGAADRFRDSTDVQVCEDGRWFFERVPVENDVEYLFVLGLWRSWRQTGDTDWMRRHLPVAERALRYSTEHPLRWSTRHGLLKRALCCDTWDFQSAPDTQDIGDTMEIAAGITRFGIFHGDNTGYAESCRLLAEMLAASGDTDLVARADAWQRLATEIQERLDALSWNGSFYRHFVYEAPEQARPWQVDPATQLSLSNAYALDRRIPTQHCAAILAHYEQLRDELPATTPAEFLSLYPPHGSDWGRPPWVYVNGGVFPFIAGELAHGAFQHDRADYGCDILARLEAIMDAHDGELPYYWIGRLQQRTVGRCTPLVIDAYCTTAFAGRPQGEAQPWPGADPDNDLSMIATGEQRFHDVPCRVVDPSANAGKACIGLGPDRERSVSIPVDATAPCIYVHHALVGGGRVGTCTIHYQDGSTYRIPVDAHWQVANWWNPLDIPPTRNGAFCYDARVAWQGRNPRHRVGTYLWGLEHPHPDRHIARIVFQADEQATWLILGLTLSDESCWLGQADAQYGWLENWNAAAIVYALLEGLAGIKDRDIGMRRLALRPQWATAGTDAVCVTARYAAGDGYCRYRYRCSGSGLEMEIASAAETIELDCPLPGGRTLDAVLIDGESRPLPDGRLRCQLSGPGVHRVAVRWAPSDP
ncbi:MAG: hypothetical protein ACOCXJ_02930 [Planctomycetota bacterium]